MDNFVENYKRIDKEVRQRISCDMIKVKCIEKDIPREERRKFIIDRINLELNRWID